VRVLVVTHYFPPEIGAPQARLSELAGHWAEHGHDVTVLTGMPNHPTGVVHDAYRGKVRVQERERGYSIVRTWLYATPNEGIAKKTLGHLTFMVSSVLLGFRRVGRPDVVVVSSPTFFSIFSAWVIARLRRARLVVEVRDLWPAIFVELGVLTNPAVIRVLERLELAAYRAADEVVVVSEGFRDHIAARGIPASKIHTIRNGVDLDRFDPAAVDEETRRVRRERLGASQEELLVLYTGAHGISHGLASIADTADLLRDEGVHFAFVGEGAAKAALEERVRILGLTNVTMLPGVPRDEVAGLLAAADVCLVPLRDVPLFTTFIPSKLFEFAAAEKAIIGAVRGEPAEILAAAGAIVIEPEDAGAMADAVLALRDDPARRADMGARARAFVREHFDRRQLAKEYLAVLER
jgi:glycosyltransferase involved in cell wall biosynthesis